MKSVKEVNGKSIIIEVEQKKHFRRFLNWPPPTTCLVIPSTKAELLVDTSPSTKAEDLRNIMTLKYGKAAGPDGILAEALRMNTQTSEDMMIPLMKKVWKEGKARDDWKKGYLFKLLKK